MRGFYKIGGAALQLAAKRTLIHQASARLEREPKTMSVANFLGRA